MSKVALVKCDSYDFYKVKKAIKRGIDLIGGISKFGFNKIAVSKNAIPIKATTSPNILATVRVEPKYNKSPAIRPIKRVRVRLDIPVPSSAPATPPRIFPASKAALPKIIAPKTSKTITIPVIFP